MFAMTMIATLILGIVSNNYGRLKACLISYMIGTVGVCCLSVVPNYWYILSMFGIMGIIVPFYIFSCLYLNELGD